eukprot:1397173-Rhodomonas_salina.1
MAASPPRSPDGTPARHAPSRQGSCHDKTRGAETSFFDHVGSHGIDTPTETAYLARALEHRGRRLLAP